MKTKKIKMALLLTTLLILLMTIVSATEASTDATSTSSNTPETKIIKDTPQVSQTDIQTVENNKNKIETNTKTDNNKTRTKTIQKDTKNNLKKDTTVNSWTELQNTIANAETETTIKLNENLTTTNTITFTKQITITIDGAGHTINGNQQQVFKINPGSSVILKNITIKNSKNDYRLGGAILNSGNLTINNSTLKNNTVTGIEEVYGGAIYNMGTLNITQSNLTQNTATGQTGIGGAIYNNGTLNITQSNLTQNTATGQTYNGDGGAIHNMGTLNITQSNLTQNTATGQHGFGGAIYNPGTLNITDSNIIENTANGQRYNGYGGAICNDWGTINITQSNLTQNKATGQEMGSGGAIRNDMGTINITQSNLNNNTATGQTYNGYGGAIHNFWGTINITQSNLTQNNATGQNGYGGAINNDDRGTLNITSSNLTQNNATGQNSGYGGAISNYGTNSNLTILNSNLTHNTATGQTYNGYGGAIHNNAGALNITESNLTQNNATGQNGYGGAINNEEGNLTITQSNLTQNNATGQNGYGGAIYNLDGLNINNSILEYNNATQGGAIYNNEGEAVIESNYFIANPSQMSGNAIINDGTATIKNNEGDKTSTYNGTIYTNSTKTVTIEGNKFYDKLNTTINISTDNAYPAIGDVINITFTLKDQLDRPIIDENITITIKDYTANKTTDITGTTSIEHTIKSNETLITATYPGNNNYNTNTTTLLVTAPKIETKLIVDDTDTKVGQNFTITGTLLDKDNQPLPEETVNITVNGTTNTATTNNLGKFNTTFTLEQMGEYPIIVIYPGTDVYNQSTNSTAKVTATKTDTKLTLHVSNTTVVNNTVVTITANLTDTNNNPLINQPVTITIGEETFNLNTNENGIINKEYTTHEVGKQSINVTYNGNNMYNANSTTTNINVYKIDTKLTLNVSNTTAVNNTQINITAILTDTDGNKLANQNITLNVAGKPFNIKTNSNGVATQNYTPTTLGKQTITATYNGDSHHNNSPEQTTTINIIKIDTKLSVKVSNSTPINNTNITITATLTDTDNKAIANQNITLNVAGKTFNLKTNSNGIATQTYTPTTIGKQTITANYNGNSQYINSTETTSITVKKINTKLAVKVSNTTPINNTSTTITATLTDTDNKAIANQNITLNVAGKTFNLKTNNNGIATQTYTPTTLGKQTITANYKGDSQYVNSNATTNITVKKINTKIDLKVSNTTPINNTPINITVTLTDADGNKLANQQVTLNINGKTITSKTNNNGIITQNYTPTKVETQNITATYTGDSRYNNSTKTIQITVKNKIKTKTTVNPATGVIGEKLTIKATVTDTNGNNVNEGNLIFKVNGVTIKDNGKLTGSSNPLKIKVVNGVATATIIPDINMTNAKNITAYYVGTTIYNASTSNPASMNISKRNATIEVTTNKKIIKQGQVLMITAKIYDTTNGKKTSNITKYQDEYVYFKVNGITLKDANGEMLKVKIINGTATVNYTIPLGISCVTDMQTLTPKNHTIQVGLYNKNYQNIMTKTPTFQVERSNITINLANATINNKTHTLSMKITIKDYLKNTVIGPNKLVIKVNGITLKNGTNVQYYYTTDGVLNLKNIPIPTAKNYTSIEVITQDRLAYNSQRNTTKVIKITN